jgi:hypothetical protein
MSHKVVDARVTGPVDALREDHAKEGPAKTSE